MTTKADHFLLICSTCKGQDHADAMRQALARDLPDGFDIREVRCMAGCDNRPTVGVQAAGKASYLFGAIETAEEIRAVREFAAQYRDSETSWTSARHRPRALYTKTLARLPALDTGGGA